MDTSNDTHPNSKYCWNIAGILASFAPFPSIPDVLNK